MLDQITSRHALHEAFARVRENAGCRGADGVTVQAFGERLEVEIDHLQDRIFRHCYHPFPLLRFSVPKRSAGVRYLAVPTVRDRVLQTAVYLATRERFEAELEEQSYAFRQGRSVRSAVHRVAELRDEGFRWVVEADIDSFFDSVSHQHLLERLRRLGFEPYLEELFERWVRAEVYDGRRVYPLDKGLPQGSVLSPALANLFLDELDEDLVRRGQKVVRYCDDLLILCRRPEEAQAALELTDALLARLELTLDPEKTRTTSFDQGFKFLGVIFLKDDLYSPYDRPAAPHGASSLPPPLDLLTYLESREPDGVHGGPLHH
ncbi:MAG: reverse transcriptase domain-containing protein [Acidobacteriota bacterium]|nr:reverse transcriptase domain-containing protein [Acidobacteriota bacterium]